jgi:hypothetical protein
LRRLRHRRATCERPHNNEMKQTKPALARLARSSLLIPGLGGRRGVMARQPASSTADRPPEGSASGPTLAYAVVPRSVRFVNKGGWWSGTRLAQRCQRVWITADRFRGGVEVWYGYSKWRVGLGGHAESLRRAKASAERFYRGLSHLWVDVRVGEAAASRYVDRLRREESCSFCHRAPAEHGGSQFQVGSVRICQSCVVEFHEELARDGRRRPTRSIWTPPVKGER